MFSKLIRTPMCKQFSGVRSYSGGIETNSAGSIRAAGGAFGKLEAAREEEYFLRKQHEQLKKLKDDQISQEIFHQKQVADLEMALIRHKECLRKLRTA